MLRRSLFIAALAVAAVALLMLTGRLPSPSHVAWTQEAGVQPGDGDCFVCHIDFDGEEIVDKHLAQKITCRSCHGPSEPHRQDETLMTKPDVLWGRAEVVAMCSQCHQGHKDPGKVAAFKAEWLHKARPNGRFIAEDAVCTDCHGEHTIPKHR
jgi:hypothetical protein